MSRFMERRKKYLKYSSSSPFLSESRFTHCILVLLCSSSPNAVPPNLSGTYPQPRYGAPSARPRSLDESIRHYGVSGLLCRFYSLFDGKSCTQTKSDLCLHCLPSTLTMYYGFPGKNELSCAYVSVFKTRYWRAYIFSPLCVHC